MRDFVTLSCPTCGGKLEITNNINQFACAHCGNEHVVIRTGGLIALEPIEMDIKKIQVSTDLTASELAIKRLTDEIWRLKEEFRIFLEEACEQPSETKRDKFGFYFFMHYIESAPLGFFDKLKMHGLWSVEKAKSIRKLTETDTHHVISIIAEKKLPASERQGISTFADQVIDYKNKIEKKQSQLARHKEIVDRF